MFVSSIVQKKTWLLVLALYVLSVVVRLPNVGRPLSKHHEANAALVLINAETWNRLSPAAFNYIPVNAYGFPGDDLRPIVDMPKGAVVNNSFGTLWYIMPYYFFKVLYVAPSPTALQWFNFLLELLVVWLVYQIALLVFNMNKRAALVTCLLYLFAPMLLWFHGNGYVHTVAVLPFYFGCVLLMLRFVKRKEWCTASYLFLYALLTVAGIQCDWLMLFLSLAAFVVGMVMYAKTKAKQYLYWSAMTCVSVVIGVAIIVVQFGSFMGYEAYFVSLQERFLLRSVGGLTEGRGVGTNASIITHYALGYGLLCVAVLLYWLLRKQFTALKLLSFSVAVTLGIAVLHHILFWGFANVHDYSVVIDGLPLALMGAAVFMYARLKTSIKYALLAAVMVTNIGIYYFINRPGNMALNGQPYNYFEVLGKKVQSVASPNDYVFIRMPEISPVLVYYSKRYYIIEDNITTAQKEFEKLPGKSAVYIDAEGFEYRSHINLKK